MVSDSRLIPRLIIHKHEEYPQHSWRLSENGEIDTAAWGAGIHNGPVCVRCGFSFCEICNPKGYDSGPCIVDEYHCPNCDQELDKNDRFCKFCGQAILKGEGEE